MVGAGEHDPLDASAPRRLEQIVAADDIGPEDGLPVGLDRLAAEMDDAVDAIAQRLAGGEVGEVGNDDFLTRTSRSRTATSDRRNSG